LSRLDSSCIAASKTGTLTRTGTVTYVLLLASSFWLPNVVIHVPVVVVVVVAVVVAAEHIKLTGTNKMSRIISVHSMQQAHKLRPHIAQSLMLHAPQLQLQLLSCSWHVVF